MTSSLVTATYEYVQFLCSDNDTDTPVYVITNKDGTAPVCRSIVAPLIPGTHRIDTVSNLPDTEDCRAKEGWIRFLSPDGSGKVHAFIGEKGKQTCKLLEDELINQQVVNVNLFLRKRLSCKQ